MKFTLAIMDLVGKLIRTDRPSISDAIKKTPLGDSAILRMFFLVSKGSVSTLFLQINIKYN